MAESAEATGKTVEDAIRRALAQLGKTRDQVTITVLAEGRQGFLGLRSEEARVLAEVLPDAFGESNTDPAAHAAIDLLDGLLRAMGIPATVCLRAPASGELEQPMLLEVSGEDMGILIGRQGETLAALQLLTSLMASKKMGRWVHLVVDVAGYRQRREKMLREMAARAAERARRFRQAVVLSPMLPNERRIVHLALQDNPHVTTKSVGEGEGRRVVIAPRP